jgi:hypothetical protein
MNPQVLSEYTWDGNMNSHNTHIMYDFQLQLGVHSPSTASGPHCSQALPAATQAQTQKPLQLAVLLAI